MDKELGKSQHPIGTAAKSRSAVCRVPASRENRAKTEKNPKSSKGMLCSIVEIVRDFFQKISKKSVEGTLSHIWDFSQLISSKNHCFWGDYESFSTSIQFLKLTKELAKMLARRFLKTHKELEQI